MYTIAWFDFAGESSGDCQLFRLNPYSRKLDWPQQEVALLRSLPIRLGMQSRDHESRNLGHIFNPEISGWNVPQSPDWKKRLELPNWL